MEYLGIDVHKVENQICILTESGEVVERRIRTQRERFAAVLGERPRAEILIEASTESEWVARCLEELGHEVVVADPNFAAMFATRSRKVKTDLRDARTLPRPSSWERIAQRIGPRTGSDTCGRSSQCGRRWCRRERATSR